MATVTIIPDFDVVEDRSTGSLTGRKTMVDAFGLESNENALHRGIVVTVANAVHADLNTMFGQRALIVSAGVLAAPFLGYSLSDIFCIHYSGVSSISSASLI